MSRLDSAIKRLQAQRSCLDLAARRIENLAGLVLELGLGNGRTYHHLRELLPERRIIVFERAVNPHAASRPPSEDLIVGDLAATLVAARAVFAGRAVLAHSDIGCGDPEVDRATAAMISTHLPPLLGRDALVVSDQPLQASDLEPQGLPPEVAAGRYFLYAKATASRQ